MTAYQSRPVTCCWDYNTVRITTLPALHLALALAVHPFLLAQRHDMHLYPRGSPCFRPFYGFTIQFCGSRGDGEKS